MSLRLPKNVSVGHAACGTAFCPVAFTIRFSAFSCAKNPRRVGGRGSDVADDVAAGTVSAGLGDRLVAADVIAMKVRVDDVADRLVAQRADRRQQLVAHVGELRVDDHHAVVADLDRRVAAGADQHVDAAADGHDVDLDAGRRDGGGAFCWATRRRGHSPPMPPAIDRQRQLRAGATLQTGSRVGVIAPAPPPAGGAVRAVASAASSTCVLR